MDKQKFDALTRAFATGTSRRTAIKGLFGGAIGVAVATSRLAPTGAQGTPCTPETVLDDCPLENECERATCEQGIGTEQFFCTYSSTCDLNCCPGGVCAECCSDDDCSGCDICDSGTCISTCSACQECEDTTCVDLDNGVCCGGTWIPSGQCCDASDCIAVAATFCSSVDCVANMCTVVPNCPEGQECCGYGEEGAYCAECCGDDDCDGCSFCNQGVCTDACPEGRKCCNGDCIPVDECCSHTDCDDCEVCGDDGACHPLLCLLGYTCCGGHECVPEDECCKDFGEFCGLEVASAGGDSHEQLDCCDGLVCCENWNSQGSVCAQCCNDWDCGKDGYCHEGVCKYPTVCHHDHDCPEHTCCCDDGSCSWHCCDHHHHHPKPPKPEPPAPTPAAPVTTLPATGSGQESDSTGLFGAAALGAAAALYAAKKLRETPEAPETTE